MRRAVRQRAIIAAHCCEFPVMEHRAVVRLRVSMTQVCVLRHARHLMKI